MLKNVELSSEADSITVSSDITLNTNGYAIQTEYANITVKRNGKLTIENQAETSEALEIPIFIESNAALDASNDAQQSLSYVGLSSNGTLICTTGAIGSLKLLDNSNDYYVTLADGSGHCTISSISAENDTVTVGNLLNKKHSGLALHAGDEQIPREQKIKSMPDSANQNLWVGACDFHEYVSSEDSTCKYCGKDLSSGMQAMISESGRYYDTIAAALDAAEEGQTIVLLTTITEHFCIGKNITIDLNSNNIEHNVTINSNSTLTLTGSGMIDVVQSGTALDGVVGGALNVLSDEVFVGVLAIGQKPTPTTNLSHGMFGNIELNTDLNMLANELLAEGYAFASSGLGEVEDGYVHSLHNIKVVEHVHDTASKKCQCGFEFQNVSVAKCTEHADSDGDGKCDYCNGELAAKITGDNGVNSIYTDLQDAINIIDDSNIYIITLLADANGSYTVEKSRSTTFKFNNKTINEIVFSNNTKVAFNDNGKVNSVIFRGNSAGFKAGNPLVTINKLTIADGASWSSILPSNIYGYQVYSDDKYKWYDKDTAAGMASMSNVKVAQLPVASEPELMINSEKLAEESSVSVYKELSFSFTSFVTNGYGGKGALFIKKEGASAPTEISADGDSYDYICPSRTFDLSEIGTFEVWATVTKDGYTRTSKKYTINVEANLKDAEVTLKQSEFTYTPKYNTGAEEFTAEIDSVKLFGNAIPSDAYTVSGDKGTDAKDYSLTITANGTSVYTGSK